MRNKKFVHLVGWALGIQVVIVLLGLLIPEMSDLQQFKNWVHWSYLAGIHQAYSIPKFNYDWLPLYLYLCKPMGMVYHLSGAVETLGYWSWVLSFFLKMQMVVFHLISGALVYGLCLYLKWTDQQARRAFLWYVFNPGIIVATHILGFQDALHTALVFGVLVALIKQRIFVLSTLVGLVLMSKPQAVIYLIPMGIYGVRKLGIKEILKGLLPGFLTVSVVLLPFIVYGQIEGVIDMYSGVSHVHEWVTGYAHNIWWFFQPVPPFMSDRTPLLMGFSALHIGLFLLFVLTVMVCVRLYRHTTDLFLLESCAFLGFVFCMVVTEIHENHLYAVFVFLIPLAVIDFRHRIYYGILSVTFALNMGLAVYWIETQQVVNAWFVRLDTVNALINVGVLIFWSIDFFTRHYGIKKDGV